MYICPVYTVVSHSAGGYPAVISALYFFGPLASTHPFCIHPFSLSFFFLLSKVMVPPPV